MTTPEPSTEELVEDFRDCKISTERNGWPSGEGQMIADRLQQQQDDLSNMKACLDVANGTCHIQDKAIIKNKAQLTIATDALNGIHKWTEEWIECVKLAEEALQQIEKGN